MWYAAEKGCPRERNLREIYTDTLDTIDTIETHYNVLSFVSFLCCFCLHITEYEQIGGGGTKLSWAQERKIPKYGPGQAQASSRKPAGRVPRSGS
jgi:hypothetical protein